MLQIKTLDPNLQSLFIVQPTDVTCNINVLPRQIGINMSACLCIWFVVPCKDTNYNGQYNNFNAILWTFFVVLRAKDVFVKYGNCHEHSHKTLVPKKDIQVGIFPFKNRLITSHSYKMASNRHASSSQSFGQRFSPSLNIPAICTLYALLLTYNTLNTLFFFTILKHWCFVFNMIFKAFIRIRKIWRGIHLT